jgi:DNA helicase-2/ATP-dependent DNA helicase PcrA
MHEKEIFNHSPEVYDFKANLNPEQLKAVENIDGPLLVLAGAGTGKTKVLTSRIANILLKGVFPGQILAVTFTNKAAREMAERVERATGGRSGGIWLGTFHSIAARILRAHSEAVGLKPNFVIIDTSDQLRLLKQIILERNIDEKKWNSKKLAGIIGSYKDKGLTADKVTYNNAFDFGGHSTAELYKTYQARLLALNVADFGDLLLYNLILLQNHPDILQTYQRRFKYILVDEYQDTNLCQYLWLRLLAQANKNICCVGDDDQSIYGWRGAEVGNILKFERDFKGASVVRLERNYRSTSHILSAASKLIANNQDRLGKTLWTEDNDGEPLKIIAVWDDREEAKYVADEIERLSLSYSGERNSRLSSIAVLVRAGFQTRAFEERFIAHSIPYRVIGGLRFYERAEIKDVIAYLRLITQSSDDLAFERIINTPKRGVGDVALKNIRNFGKKNNLSMFDAAQLLVSSSQLRGENLAGGADGIDSADFSAKKTGNPQADGATLKGKTGIAVTQFVGMIEKWKSLPEGITVPELAQTILKEAGYLDMLKAEDSLEAEGKSENIKELLRALEEFETLESFLEHVSLVSDIDSLSQDNMVGIMTMHAAKGLEFETVFLPGWEEGLFPSQRSTDESGTKGLEEERRLAYVGITRAKKRCYILYAANRRVYNQFQSSVPSRFIEELPSDNIEKINMGNGLGFRLQESWGMDQDYNSYHPAKNSSKSISTPPNPNSCNLKPKFRIGARVFHVKFGYGKIVGISGNQLDVLFEKAGIKKVIESYIETA